MGFQKAFKSPEASNGIPLSHAVHNGPHFVYEMKINNYFSDFMISSSTTYILPRVVLLSVSYKL